MKSNHPMFIGNSALIELIFAVIIFFPPALSAAGDNLFPPAEYIQAKPKRNDIVFLYATHRKPKILSFIADLIPSLKWLDVTHIGLEIPSDQQERIDSYIQSGIGLDSIILHKQIDTPEYRHLFEVLRESGGPIPEAIDLPFTRQGGSISRDEWMSRSLLFIAG